MKVCVLLLPLLTAIITYAQPAIDYPDMKTPDRESQNLLGPVKVCEEETIYPSAGANETPIPQGRSITRTEYTPEGRLISTTQSYQGQQSITRNEYDSSGRLLKTISESPGQKPYETVYRYDSNGRLQRIINSSQPESPKIFQYDDHGRKSQVTKSRPEDYRPNVSTAGSPFDVTGQPPNPPGGGTSTVLYDDHDRPIEVQLRDSHGKLISHSVRTYDSQGRVSEEKQIVDHPELLIPENVREQIVAETQATPEELREQFKQVLGDQSTLFSSSYSYDSKGRLTETRLHIFNQEQRVETTYNEHGDIASQITQAIPDPATNAGTNRDQPQAAPSPFTNTSEVRYTYQYDERGNWIEQTTSYRNGPDGNFQTSSHRRRTLTYY